jgi:hypothetical protein
MKTLQCKPRKSHTLLFVWHNSNAFYTAGNRSEIIIRIDYKKKIPSSGVLCVPLTAEEGDDVSTVH